MVWKYARRAKGKYVDVSLNPPARMFGGPCGHASTTQVYVHIPLFDFELNVHAYGLMTT